MKRGSIKSLVLTLLVAILLPNCEKNSTGIEGDNNSENIVVMGDGNHIYFRNEQRGIGFVELKADTNFQAASDGENYANLEFLVLVPKKFHDSRILGMLSDSIAQDLYGPEFIPGDFSKSIERYVNDFFESAQEMFLALEGSGLNYIIEQSNNMEIVYQDEKVLSIKYDEIRIESGMAHEYFNTRYVNYDMVKGSRIELSDVFFDKGLDGLTVKLNRKLREFYGLSEDQSLKEAGFYEDNGFLPENFFFTDNGFCFFFAPYEQAPFAALDSWACFTIDEIQLFLRDNSPIKKSYVGTPRNDRFF